MSCAYLDADDAACTAFCVRLALPSDRPVRLRVREGGRLVVAVDDEGAEAGEQPAPHVLQLRGGGGVWVVGWFAGKAPPTLAVESVAARADAPPTLVDLADLARRTAPPPASWWSAVVSPLESARLLHAVKEELDGDGALPDPAADHAAFARRFTQCTTLIARVGAYRARNEACARLRAHNARHVTVAWDAAACAMRALVGVYYAALIPGSGGAAGSAADHRDLFDHM